MNVLWSGTLDHWSGSQVDGVRWTWTNARYSNVGRELIASTRTATSAVNVTSATRVNTRHAAHGTSM